MIQDPGSRILDPGSWIQSPGSRIQDPRSKILGPTTWCRREPLPPVTRPLTVVPLAWWVTVHMQSVKREATMRDGAGWGEMGRDGARWGEMKQDRRR